MIAPQGAKCLELTGTQMWESFRTAEAMAEGRASIEAWLDELSDWGEALDLFRYPRSGRLEVWSVRWRGEGPAEGAVHRGQTLRTRSGPCSCGQVDTEWLELPVQPPDWTLKLALELAGQPAPNGDPG